MRPSSTDWPGRRPAGKRRRPAALPGSRGGPGLSDLHGAGGLLGVADAQQLNLEEERRARGDRAAGAGVVAVGEVGGDRDFPGRADLHLLESLGPTLDDAVDRESRGLAALVRAVEDGAV